MVKSHVKIENNKTVRVVEGITSKSKYVVPKQGIKEDFVELHYKYIDRTGGISTTHSLIFYLRQRDVSNVIENIFIRSRTRGRLAKIPGMHTGTGLTVAITARAVLAAGFSPVSVDSRKNKGQIMWMQGLVY